MGKLARLLIPRKTQNPVQQPDYGTDMRAIEQWAQNVGGIIEITSNDATVTITDPFGPITDLSASGGGGFTPYASLLGPGETATPGALTQTGQLTISGAGLVVTGGSPASANVANTGGFVYLSKLGAGGGVVVEASGAGSTASLTALSGSANVSAINVEIDAGGICLIQGGAGDLAFFNTTAHSPQLSVSGSRAGNPALANLLTALASYNLIIDTTTP